MLMHIFLSSITDLSVCMETICEEAPKWALNDLEGCKTGKLSIINKSRLCLVRIAKFERKNG